MHIFSGVGRTSRSFNLPFNYGHSIFQFIFPILCTEALIFPPGKKKKEKKKSCLGCDSGLVIDSLSNGLTNLKPNIPQPNTRFLKLFCITGPDLFRAFMVKWIHHLHLQKKKFFIFRPFQLLLFVGNSLIGRFCSQFTHF